MKSNTQTKLSRLQKRIDAMLKEQTGWTTMEYVVGAIALVAVVSAVLAVFKEKLISAINTLQLIQ